jgi:hypothetical protein
MPGVTREQIDRAKQVGILEYVLSREPDNVRRVGGAHYLKDHDSLEISNGLWNWHSQGIGGRNVVDYLMKVRGYSFVDAVRHLADDGASYAAIPKAAPLPKEKQPFSPPPRNRSNDRAIAYLQKRGIPKPLIMECIENGSIYESKEWHNCVFVGRDENGRARSAALRGTAGDFKRDAGGSEKRYGFAIPPHGPGSDTVAVFESPVDALSHKALCPSFGGWRLSLGCASTAALANFLERHGEVKNVIACTDNDRAGEAAAAKIAAIQGITAARSLPPTGKDWNEALQAQETSQKAVPTNRKEVTKLEDKRKTIRFIDSSHNTLFTVKDGESIRVTVAYDGETKDLKCRYIDDVHMQLTGKYRDDWHICEFAEKMEQTGNKYEAIPGQEAKLNILAAKYGEPLQEAEIPMTEDAIKDIIGEYESEKLYGASNNHVGGMLLKGRDGVAVCGIDGDTPTSLHVYLAQKYKREVSTEPPAKQPVAGRLAEAKAEAAAHNAGRAKEQNGIKPEGR